MEVFSKSDIGLVRTQNQDDFRFGVISPSCVWAVVCDGMGGANGGNIASATATEYIRYDKGANRRAHGGNRYERQLAGF